MVFKLNKGQQEKYDKWVDEELVDVKLDRLGSRESFIFIPHSRGVAIKVVYDDKELDLTDYSEDDESIVTEEIGLTEELCKDIQHVCLWYQGRKVDTLERVEDWLDEIKLKKSYK